MKNLLLCVLLVVMPFAAYATQQTIRDEGSFTYENRFRINDNFTELYNYSTGAAVNTFTTALTGNPLVFDTYKSTFVSTTGLYSTGVVTLIASSAGKTIYPSNVTIMASGTGATATGLAIECSDGTLIASWPVALLTSLRPLDAYASSAVARGSALGRGCPASTAVVLSNVGTQITTTTYVDTHVIYTVQ